MTRLPTEFSTDITIVYIYVNKKKEEDNEPRALHEESHWIINQPV
jgi:hypothetical protein